MQNRRIARVDHAHKGSATTTPTTGAVRFDGVNAYASKGMTTVATRTESHTITAAHSAVSLMARMRILRRESI
jgi:hypothetical protein